MKLKFIFCACCIGIFLQDAFSENRFSCNYHQNYNENNIILNCDPYGRVCGPNTVCRETDSCIPGDCFYSTSSINTEGAIRYCSQDSDLIREYNDGFYHCPFLLSCTACDNDSDWSCSGGYCSQEYDGTCSGNTTNVASPTSNGTCSSRSTRYKCNANYYGENPTANSGCTACPANSTSTAGSTSCRCNANHYGGGTSSSPCIACPDSGISAAGSTAITSCYKTGSGSDDIGDYTYSAGSCYYTN